MLPEQGKGWGATPDPKTRLISSPSLPWPTVSDPSDRSSPPLDGFALDVGDDLLAAAVAAVEARTRKAPPNPDEMAAFEEDLLVGDVDLAAGEPTDNEDSDAGVGVVFDDGSETHGEGAQGPSEAGGESLFGEALERVDSLTEALAEQEQQAHSLAEERDDLRGQVATLTAALEQERTDKRKAVGLARRWKERAERAEQRLTVSRDAGDAAEERALRAESAIQEVEERAQEDLRRASARRLKEVDEVRHAAPGKVLKELFPAIDNLELALRHADQDPSRVIEGLTMIQGQFSASLVRLGVERVESTPGTRFSPERHEAFSQEETDEVPPGTILSEVAAGYRIGDRLLRAARVVVALAPASPEPGADGDEASTEASSAPPQSAAAQPESTAAVPETSEGLDSESAHSDSITEDHTDGDQTPDAG